MSASESLSPMETLFESRVGPELPLPGPIERVYGRLGFPEHRGRPYMYSNFVTTLDGVVTLGLPGQSGGGPISGFNRQDVFLMGLLRAVADVVIISSAILTVAPNQVWTPEAVYPPMAAAFHELRAALGKPAEPTVVIITARGEIDVDLPVFHNGIMPVAILTTPPGERVLSAHLLPKGIQVLTTQAEELISADQMIAAIQQISPEGLYLMEAGPHLHAEFIAGGQLDEIFLTLAPQVAGRIGADIRPGLVAGQIFAPDHAVWSTLYSIKRSGSHLFLRYGLKNAG